MLSFQIQKKSVEFLRLSRAYATFRGDDPVLEPYPTFDALLAALEPSGGADRSTQSLLVCAILAKHKAAPGPLAPAILLHAFRGMLGRISKHLVGIDDRDEADLLVASAMLEALGRVRPGRDPSRISMYLRQETRRVLFAGIQRDMRARLYWQEDDGDSDAPAPAGDSAARPDDDAVAWEDDGEDLGRSQPRSRWVDPDTLADPASLVPIEERLDSKRPAASRVSDEDLLRAHAVRGGLRRLVQCLFEDTTTRRREHEYRRLLRRAWRLDTRRK